MLIVAVVQWMTVGCAGVVAVLGVSLMALGVVRRRQALLPGAVCTAVATGTLCAAWWVLAAG